MNTAGAACLRFALCKQDVAPMATTPYAPQPFQPFPVAVQALELE